MTLGALLGAAARLGAGLASAPASTAVCSACDADVGGLPLVKPGRRAARRTVRSAARSPAGRRSTRRKASSAQAGMARAARRPAAARPRAAASSQAQRRATVDGQLGEQRVAHRVEQLVLVLDVPVQRHRRDAELLAEPADGHRVEALGVGDVRAPARRSRSRLSAVRSLSSFGHHLDNYTPYRVSYTHVNVRRIGEPRR